MNENENMVILAVQGQAITCRHDDTVVPCYRFTKNWITAIANDNTSAVSLNFIIGVHNVYPLSKCEVAFMLIPPGCLCKGYTG